MALPGTSIIAIILVAIMLPLTLQVSLRRAALGKQLGDLGAAGYGDMDDDLLKRRGRAFGNFIEYVPFGLLLIGLIEIQGATINWVAVAGGTLIVGRVIHAGAVLYTNVPPLRAVGMIFTYLGFLTPLLWLLVHV